MLNKVLTNTLDAYLAAACNYSMPIKSYHGQKTQSTGGHNKLQHCTKPRLQQDGNAKGCGIGEGLKSVEQMVREKLKASSVAIRKSQENS